MVKIIPLPPSDHSALGEDIIAPDLINVLGPRLWNQNVVMFMIGIELSLLGIFSPRIILGLFIILQGIHLSLCCDAGKRVLEQIALRIRSTVVFLEYLETRKSILTILSSLSIIPTYRRYFTGQVCLAHIADPCTRVCITFLHPV